VAVAEKGNAQCSAHWRSLTGSRLITVWIPPSDPIPVLIEIPVIAFIDPARASVRDYDYCTADYSDTVCAARALVGKKCK
jgi:hypothetical protein